MRSVTNALIIDASCFAEDNLRAEIKQAIRENRVSPIWSRNGLLAKELRAANVKRYASYELAKKFFDVCNVCVKRKTEHLISNGGLTSDDAHVVALALVSGANTLASNDCRLIRDFQRCKEIDTNSSCKRRNGRAISRSVIKPNAPRKRDVNKLLQDASVKYKHCLCQCTQSGC